MRDSNRRITSVTKESSGTRELTVPVLSKEIIQDRKWYFVTGSIFYRSKLCKRIGSRVYHISCFKGSTMLSITLINDVTNFEATVTLESWPMITIVLESVTMITSL